MREDSGLNPLDPYKAPAAPAPAPTSGNGPPLASERITAEELPARSPVPPSVATTDKDKKPPEQKDAFREIVETVVFVVVLVLLLKAFMAEAFVIPTGSMATTLRGYHREIVCPECKYRFPVNLSKQLDAQESHPQRVTGCECPNCRLKIDSSNSDDFRGP